MPRTARKLSGSNIYHVMLRGVNRQIIFEEDEDRLYFVKTMAYCKKLSGFRLHAFALMSNHVHLLVEPAEEPLDLAIRRLGIRYALWFNRKYERVGYLFQGRFLSENVEDELYYMTVLRYILQNPMKAGLESRPGSYRWSSYLAYQSGKGTITDTQYATELFGGREKLVEYVLEENEDDVMDEAYFDRRLKDEKARETMRRITKCDSVAAFQQLDPDLQKEFAYRLCRAGLSFSQTARLTGLNRSAVYRAVQKYKTPDAEEEETTLREADTEFTFWDDSLVW